MFDRIKKPLAIFICAATFFWFVYTCYVFYFIILDWANLTVSGADFMFEILMLVLKNLPSFIILKIVKSWFN